MSSEEERTTLLALPPEILVLICCTPSVKARDLLALELTCSHFHQGIVGVRSIPEQAAKQKLKDLINLEGHERETAPLLSNFKAILFYLQDNTRVPAFACPTCGWRIGGFRCQGRRPPHLVRGWASTDTVKPEDEVAQNVPPVPEPTGCDCNLVWSDKEQQLFCPLGCGKVAVPCCSCKAYQKRDEEGRRLLFDYMVPSYIKQDDNLRTTLLPVRNLPNNDKIDEEAEQEKLMAMYYYVPSEPIRKKAPALTCISCGYTVDGYACLGKPDNESHKPDSHPPLPILQEGFYERVWCSYRWGCPLSCRVFRDGPEQLDGDHDDYQDSSVLRCLSKPGCDRRFEKFPAKKGTEMSALEWRETLGPPTNFFPFIPIKLTKE